MVSKAAQTGVVAGTTEKVTTNKSHMKNRLKYSKRVTRNNPNCA